MRTCVQLCPAAEPGDCGAGAEGGRASGGSDVGVTSEAARGGDGVADHGEKGWWVTGSGAVASSPKVTSWMWCRDLIDQCPRGRGGESGGVGQVGGQAGDHVHDLLGGVLAGQVASVAHDPGDPGSVEEGHRGPGLRNLPAVARPISAKLSGSTQPVSDCFRLPDHRRALPAHVSAVTGLAPMITQLWRGFDRGTTRDGLRQENDMARKRATRDNRGNTLPPREESFALVCTNAELNLQDSLDLIAVHAEQPVNGRQPRAALNSAIAVTAIASWERFIADLVGAVTPMDSRLESNGAEACRDRGWPPGTFEGDSCFHPRDVGGRLRNLGYLDDPRLVERWVVDVPTSWRGTRPGSWKRLGLGTETTWGVDEYLASAILVRNAGAHRATEALAEAARRRNLPFLDSDAQRTTIQNGHSRGIVALVLQILDSTIAAVCHDRQWSTGHRLPQRWFDGGTQRGGRHDGIDFWHRTLPRVPCS